MQKVKLVGEISKFGENWETSCINIRDIFKLIECQTPGFRQHLLAAADAGVGYEIKRGDEFLEYGEELFLSLGEEDIIITEVPAGSKSAGAKILAAILIVTAVVVSAGGFGAAGIAAEGFKFSTMQLVGLSVAANLALGGVTQLLAPGPETDKKENEGYLFNGPVNTVSQGLPVPVCYGELRIGGAPIGVSFRGMGGTGSGSAAGNLDAGKNAGQTTFSLH